ncbi:hypothetical protein ACJ41O_012836 [Fusarium nematophilum]
MRKTDLAHGLTCVLPFSNPLLQSRASSTGTQDGQSPSEDLYELFGDDVEGVGYLEDDGLDSLPSVNSEIAQWDAGRIPQACWNVTQAKGEDDFVGGSCPLSKLEVYNVTYDDCSDPWVFCRCSDANDNLETVVSDFGRLPVAARDNVRHVILSAKYESKDLGELQAVALYWDGDLVIYRNWTTVGLLVHEVSHSLDYWVATDEESMYSETQEWRDIVDSDTCVASSYAKSTYTETFAETAVMVAYDLNIASIDKVINYTCMSNTFEAVKGKLSDYLTYNEGSTCSNRFAQSEILCLRDDGEISACEDSPSDKDSAANSEDEESGAPCGASIGGLPILAAGTVTLLLGSLGLFT